MKRSEATPEILEALEDPENIYSFEEDDLEWEIGRSFIKERGWNMYRLTDEQRVAVELYVQEKMKSME